ncbi:MAG: hypothetical protein CVU12_02450 [Bacteroidetes bacterium HGW-Bacteroidetes-7]|nr:MAG: hypothetical protein CVU12_02450 [Bacteroidetes bacterium HGW-Bacteroidetes-7]
MDIINTIHDNLNKTILFALLFCASFLSGFVILRVGIIPGLLVSMAPLLVAGLIFLLNKPLWAFIILFVMNYYVSGLSRYIQGVSPGIVMDILLIMTIAVLIFQSFRKSSEYSLSRVANPVTFLSLIWFIYCALQIFNPISSSSLAWIMNVRGIGVYFLLISIVTSLFLRKYKHLNTIMIIWAILALTAVTKAVLQKTVGFDFAENRWLAEGARSTHILYSGIRYFSFFTDAGNFGSGMGFTSVVFLIFGFNIKMSSRKILYIITGLACLYGMIISGTRGSLVIPFIGILYYAFISKNFKAIVSSIILVVFLIGFLKFTYIGHSNQYIRRMRSIFNEQDASFRGRIDNQKLVKELMRDKPFGVGIGMMRSKAIAYRPHPVLSAIPHDSWYILIWAELGIVGLVLYLFILFYILMHGSYLVLFKLKNRELRGVVSSILCGLFGLYAAAYSLEIFGQFPNAYIIFICMTVVFLSPIYDKELNDRAGDLQKT